jgi:formate dehydrogenase subunit gamma
MTSATTGITTDAPHGASGDITRFDRVERFVHWTTACLFGVLMLTGAALYAGPVSTLVGRRELMRTLHVMAGLALPVPLIVGLVGKWGKHLRADLSKLNRWNADDRRWLRRKRRATARLGKFNPGQKINAVFLGGAAVVMFGTGAMLHWFSLIPLDWRTGATFVHDWFALGIWLSISGHLYFAFRDPVALCGMLRGTVTARWARTERPRWYEDETGAPSPTAAPNESAPNESAEVR